MLVRCDSQWGLLHLMRRDLNPDQRLQISYKFRINFRYFFVDKITIQPYHRDVSNAVVPSHCGYLDHFPAASTGIKSNGLSGTKFIVT